MKKIFVILSLIIFTSSACEFRPPAGAPWQQELLKHGPKNAQPLFQQGWSDGCETGIATTSSALLRHFYDFKQNPDLAQNATYYTGWKTAFWYCSRYVMQYLRRAYL